MAVTAGTALHVEMDRAICFDRVILVAAFADSRVVCSGVLRWVQRPAKVCLLCTARLAKNCQNGRTRAEEVTRRPIAPSS